MNEKEMQYAIASTLGFRQKIIVPNVSWGAGLHECDLLVISKYNWATEIEIKISKSDLKADLKKKHHHSSEKIRQLFFAIPNELYSECKDLVPIEAGIYTVKHYKEGFYSVDCKREASINKGARKLTDLEVLNIARLGNMHTWSLRKKELESEGLLAPVKKINRRERYDYEMHLMLYNLSKDFQRNEYSRDQLISKSDDINRLLEKIDKKKILKNQDNN